MSASDVREHNHESAMICFSVAVVGCLLGIAAILAVSRTANYKRLMAPRSLSLNEDNKTIGDSFSVAKQRWSVRVVRIDMIFISMTRAVWLYILALAPYVKPVVPDSFWIHNLATILIVGANFGDFAGRLLANYVSIVRVRTLVLCGMARVLFLIFTVVYITSNTFMSDIGWGNIAIIACFTFMSVTHGLFVVR